jgi:hypothetical protein
MQNVIRSETTDSNYGTDDTEDKDDEKGNDCFTEQCHQQLRLYTATVVDK